MIETENGESTGMFDEFSSKEVAHTSQSSFPKISVAPSCFCEIT